MTNTNFAARNASVILPRKRITIMRKRMPLAVAIVALLILGATVRAGGWVVVTLRDLPEYAVAGKPLQLVFTVRGAGISPTGGLLPKVAAISGSNRLSASASETKTEGEYKTTLVFPHPGNWIIRIDAFGDGDPSRWSGSTIPELLVIYSGSSAPTALSPIEVGERLFVAKGCPVCHINHEERVARALELHMLPQVLSYPALDLFGKRFPEAYLKRFLANPEAASVRDPDEVSWRMPNLDLTQSEIAALTAFLNSDRPR
jgi:hypothetical protein